MTNNKTYKVEDKKLIEVNEPSIPYNKSYSYADYLTWKIKERVELIKGKIFKMSPAPSLNHQRILGDIFIAMNLFLKHHNCKVFIAPFDVRFIRKSTNDKDIETVLQPDLCVICDPNKLDSRGCIGSPDLIVEILSPSTSHKDLSYKYDIYESHGVKEYWVVHPLEQTLLIYTLIDNKYQPSRLMTRGHIASSSIIEGFTLDLNDVFEEIPTPVDPPNYRRV